MKLTAPQRGVLASFAFLLISMLSAQALAFDVDGLSYTILNGTDVEVTGCDVAPCASKDITIPATASDSGTTYSVTSIGNKAFQRNALTSVTIGNRVTSIGDVAFSNNDLTSVIIPNSVTSIGWGVFQANALTSVTIGNSVTSIGDSAFYESALTSVIIPDSVTTIGSEAFANNALTRVTIGNSMETIGEQAFYNNALISAAFLGNFGTFDLNMFQANASLATITYAQGAAGWPQTFTPNTGPAGSVTATPAAAPTATPVPTSPLWLMAIMAGLLSLVGISKLRKA